LSTIQAHFIAKILQYSIREFENLMLKNFWFIRLKGVPDVLPVPGVFSGQSATLRKIA